MWLVGVIVGVVGVVSVVGVVGVIVGVVGVTLRVETPKAGSPRAAFLGTTFCHTLSVARTCSLVSCTGRSQKWCLVFTRIGTHQVMLIGASA